MSAQLTAPQEHAARALRADASRNRAAILSAAQDAFAKHGLQAPLGDIARRAGVGIGTLYRRFPTREDLVAAALAEKITAYADAACEALAYADPWEGFASLVGSISELQAGDRGLCDLLSQGLPAGPQVERLRAAAHGHMTQVVARAKAAGRLRPDFTADDLTLLLIASSAVAHAMHTDSPDAWRRFVALLLDAFQHSGGQLPVPAAADR